MTTLDPGPPTGPETPVWRDPARSAADRVDDLLARMTLEEKVAQLGSRWAGNDMQHDDLDPDSEINVAPMEDVFAASGTVPLDEASRHGLGHLTRVYGSVPLSVAEGVAELIRQHHTVLDGTRLRIPALVHEECLTGFTTYGATVYPAAIAWGATFDPDLIERMAAAIGRDMAAVGVHQGLSPVLDVVRDYRWGRVEETIGEDPYLVAMLGSAYVRGLQSAGVIATLKHFAGYSASRGARNHGPVPMGRRELLDVILPTFETAIAAAGAGSVMNSYSDVDGVPAVADSWLLTDLLRGEWGFTGTVVSDYWAIPFLATMHHVAADAGDAGAQALAAGLDVELPDTLGFGAGLIERVRRGEVPEALVDRAARRLLRAEGRARAARPGLDAGGVDRPTRGGRPGLGGQPRARPGRRGAVDRAAGRRAPRCRCRRRLRQGGGGRPVRPATRGRSWAATPSPTTCCRATPGSGSASRCRPRPTRCGPSCRTPRSCTSRAARSPATTGPGSPPRSPPPATPTSCVALVGDLAGLFGHGSSGEGCDAADLRLPGVQADLVAALLARGTPVVVVVVSGRPYALGEVHPRAAGLVQAFMPGEEGGAAIAGVLSGRVQPGGKLPVQIPRLPGGQPGTYLQPPLGVAERRHQQPRPDAAVPVRARRLVHHVRGGRPADQRRRGADRRRVHGDRPGDATPATGPVTRSSSCTCTTWSRQVTRPVRQLAGFARVHLDPGAAADVRFPCTPTGPRSPGAT